MTKIFSIAVIFFTISNFSQAQIYHNIDLATAKKEPWKQVPASKKNAKLGKDAAMIINGNSISLMGRKVELDKNGFPKQIQTFFNPELTAIADTANNLLFENIHFHFTRKSDGKNIKLKDEGPVFLIAKKDKATWKASSIGDSLQVDVSGEISSAGLLTYIVKVTAFQDIQFKEVTMHIPFNPTMVTYLSGFGQQGGLRPEKVDWKWQNSQSFGWIGNVNGGLQYHLTTGTKRNSWSNEGKGGVGIGIKGSSMLANNFTGEHEMKKGEVLFYNFDLMITPTSLPK